MCLGCAVASGSTTMEKHTKQIQYLDGTQGYNEPMKSSYGPSQGNYKKSSY